MDKSLIIKRLKNAKNIQSDAELAIFLGISKSTLSNWYKRNSIDYDLLFSKCEPINIDWLLTGTGSMLRSGVVSPVQVAPAVPAPQAPTPAPQAPDTSSMHYIMQRYESLIAENALLKKEVEELKQSRGKSIGPTSYTIGEKPGTF